MTQVFLCYSSSYGHLLEPLRKLLQTLEFKVDVFDGPDIERPPFASFIQRIESADGVVALLGPKSPPPSDHSAQGDLEPAPCPEQESVYAAGREKPVALIVHTGTRVPEAFRESQTAARFDFWDASSFLTNAHHVVKHLLDLKRRIDLPQGTQPFLYTNVVLRNRISRTGMLCREQYHEIIPRIKLARFRHSLDTGFDHTEGARIELVSEDAYEIEATLGGDTHRVSLQLAERTARELWYFVNVDPPLMPGEKLGYRRSFDLRNYYPLTQAELAERARQPGFPDVYKVAHRLYYGYVFDVHAELDSLELAFHFPRKVQVLSYRAIALLHGTRQVNDVETDRCSLANHLGLAEAADASERVLSLKLPRPLNSHSYVLLYEPG
ncbi:MAG TPA: hypothetical protein VNE39_28300 [Planctomycetota bacterium]|nr:hypothetical protein [Planctomycetota bacterium]